MMKKILACILCFVFVTSLFSGCNASEKPKETTQPTASHTLQAGFGRVDITPQGEVPLRGHSGSSSNRMSTGVLDPLYATCISLTDETNNTVLLFHLDTQGCYDDTFLWIRSKVAKAVDVPVNNIMICATHMHSGPDIQNKDFTNIENYLTSLNGWLIEAAKLSLADRKPAEIFTSKCYPKQLNFVRHYVMDDGSITGDNFGKTAGKKYVGHATEADNEMQLVKFAREGAKDIILANWQGHPHRAAFGAKELQTKVTSDIVGVMRTEMENRLDCQFAYFTGASGNVNNTSRIAEEVITKDYLEHGKAMADYAVTAADSFKKVENGLVQIKKTICQTTININDRDYDSPITLYTLALGDLAFVFAPYEMFDTNGKQIKEASPFETTIVATCSNEMYGYVPSEQAYQYGAQYEVGICRFVRGTGELFVRDFTAALKTLYETRK